MHTPYRFYEILNLFNLNTYVGPPCCRAEMFAGCVHFWATRMLLLVSHGEYADGTDGRTPDRYITLSARRGQRNKEFAYVGEIE